jgi:catalase-peroxidase
LGDDKRYNASSGERDLDKPLGAVQMGLIYVNPEGPAGNPDPLASAKDIRETFGRMAMNDEETVALIAGGHTFGKCHGAGDAGNMGVEPEGAPIEDQGFGWKNKMGEGKGKSTITSGLEGAWTYKPTEWDNDYFNILFGYEWELTKSPAGACQWKPKGSAGAGTVPDAHDPDTRHTPIMLTSDLALRMDPIYEEISRRFYQNPDEFKKAFAKAWYKLTHRDMGPYSRCLGPEVPPPQIWQDPVPEVSHSLVNAADQIKLKKMLLGSGVSPSRLVATAWASASTYRKSDKRGGANGARVRLSPQKFWEVNEPVELETALTALEKIRSTFNASGTRISMADLIVLGGCAGVEAAAKAAGFQVAVPFTAGRTDATQDMTDVESFAVLEPVADGFRNYIRPGFDSVKAEELLIDRAYLLDLTAPELTVLVGGLRVLGVGTSSTSPMTTRVGTLSNDFFVNLLDMSTEWVKAGENLYEGRVRGSGRTRWKASRVDLVFGAHSVLRAIAEEYACDDAKTKFMEDFCKAFAKVMDASGNSMALRSSL